MEQWSKGVEGMYLCYGWYSELREYTRYVLFVEHWGHGFEYHGLASG
jgi:hypothetical protein